MDAASLILGKRRIQAKHQDTKIRTSGIFEVRAGSRNRGPKNEKRRAGQQMRAAAALLVHQGKIKCYRSSWSPFLQDGFGDS